MLAHLINILYGMIFGIANVIPGVSGGTMLVVFGCYDKVCGALTFNLKEIKKNIVFLIFFGIGAVIGIVGFSFVITRLFESHPIATNMFFMGLIVGSVPLILRYATVKEKFRPICIVPFLIGLAAVVGLTAAEKFSADPYTIDASASNGITTFEIVNRSDKTIESWEITLEGENISLDSEKTKGAQTAADQSTFDKIKNMLGMETEKTAPNMFVSEENTVIEPHGSYTFTYEGELENVTPDISVSYTMNTVFFLTMIASLFIAAIAMIIPGVSGSFVLVTLGVYSTVIGAIKSFDMLIIIPCAIGAVIGLVSGARLITMLMKKYSLLVYSAILGLVAGSLFAIFPDGFGFNVPTLIGFFAFAAGAAVAFITGKKTKVEAASEN